MFPITAFHQNFDDMKECIVFYSKLSPVYEYVTKYDQSWRLLSFLCLNEVRYDLYYDLLYLSKLPLFILNYYMPAYRDSDEIAGAVIGTLLGGTILVLVIIYFVRNYCHHKRQASLVRSGGTIAIFCTGNILVYLGYDDKIKNLNFLGRTIVTIS